MLKGYAEISVKGKVTKVPAISISNVTVVVMGRWIKTASIKDEFWLEGDVVGDPELILNRLKEEKANADIFTFSQKLPYIEPKYDYHFEWHNVAAIPITSFADWWEKRLPQVTRKNVRRAQRREVVVKHVDFSDALVTGIMAINNETPIRQGRPFWHYGKSFETVRKDYSDFLDRSGFLGAYYRNELVGFMRLIYQGEVVNILQLLCMNKHYDKRPANALISKAVELCAERGASHLVYGQYIYGNNTKSPLTEFKRRNGFSQIFTPTYYIPITTKGWLFLKLKLHLGIKRLIPEEILYILNNIRGRIYQSGMLKNAPFGKGMD